MTKIRIRYSLSIFAHFCHFRRFCHSEQAGQTLIETLVAIFMLIMGVSAALGLAIFALASSGNITKQIIATGLAREGLEAVKNMRDTNWLRGALSDPTANPPGCYNYIDASNTATCYKSWLGTSNNAPYCIDPTDNNGNNCNGSIPPGTYQDFNLGFDSSKSGTDYWNFNRQRNSNDFGLIYDRANSTGNGFYYAKNGVTCANGGGISDYCRKITLTKIITPPYNQDAGPMLRVQSFVWWVDKKCPRVLDWPQASASCRVEMDTYLTNWKTY